MAPEKKSKKSRKSKYEEKLKVNGSFDDLLKELVSPPQEGPVFYKLERPEKKDKDK